MRNYTNLTAQPVPTLPRDLQPGDVITRRPNTSLGAGMPQVVSIREVVKVKTVRGTAYRVHLNEWDDLQPWERAVVANNHLRSFILSPRERVGVIPQETP